MEGSYKKNVFVVLLSLLGAVALALVAGCGGGGDTTASSAPPEGSSSSASPEGSSPPATSDQPVTMAQWFSDGGLQHMADVFAAFEAVPQNSGRTDPTSQAWAVNLRDTIVDAQGYPDAPDATFAAEWGGFLADTHTVADDIVAATQASSDVDAQQPLQEATAYWGDAGQHLGALQTQVNELATPPTTQPQGDQQGSNNQFPTNADLQQQMRNTQNTFNIGEGLLFGGY
jgi:hypothetical protein